MKPITVEEMMKDGCTEKCANIYFNLLKEENESGMFDDDFLKWAHTNGFLARSVCLFHLNENNIDNYLCDYDAYRIWPLNSWMRIWVNDKLTLKYMLAGTDYDGVMPKYYYYSMKDGLRRLIDNPDHDQTIDGLLEVLRAEKNLACKPANGALSCGFFKLSFEEGSYYINNEKCSAEDIRDFVVSHPNYVFTEYLFPEKSLAEFSHNIIHTIRIVVLNKDGISPRILGGWIRFATQKHSLANCMYNEFNEADFNLSAGIDFETGKFGNAQELYKDKIVPASCHPDTGRILEGEIPNWHTVKEVVLNLSRRFFGIEWMGFDLCVDINGNVRIMEINTHPDTMIHQVFAPLLLDEDFKNYYEGKMHEIDQLSEEEKALRIKIPR